MGLTLNFQLEMDISNFSIRKTLVSENLECRRRHDSGQLWKGAS